MTAPEKTKGAEFPVWLGVLVGVPACLALWTLFVEWLWGVFLIGSLGEPSRLYAFGLISAVGLVWHLSRVKLRGWIGSGVLLLFVWYWMLAAGLVLGVL